MDQDANSLSCPECYFSTTIHAELMKHYVKKHRNCSDFQVKCSICSRKYSNIASLKSHFYQKHGGKGVPEEMCSFICVFSVCSS